MKRLLIVLMAVLFTGIFACQKDEVKVVEEIPTNEYADITATFSVNDFELAKAFILNNGDRKTYRSFDSNNPHYPFTGFEAYLNAEIGQGNINNDPVISGFNQITLRDQNANPQYYTIHIVRKGDNSKANITKPFEGLKEERVYLLNSQDNDIEAMKTNLNGYIQVIKSAIQ